MNAVVLVAFSLLAFFLAQRVYARWLERRVYRMDSDEPTPAHVRPDGVDFVACRRHVLFGHHFCSIAGAAPIVGPAIAVIWGWVPALLWVVFGTIFIGAVHDFGALAISAKRGGSTIGDLAGQILGPRARVYFLGVLILLTWIIIAVFAYVIAVLFTKFPASVIPVNFEIAVAVVMGWWIYRKRGSLTWPSIAAVTLLYVVVFVCAAKPEWGVLPESIRLYGKSEVTWIVLLLVYAYVASVLPVWLLLQPRDYINSHQLFVGLGALLLGIVITHPQVVAPAINTNVDPLAVPIIPFLFITIACGAISGFHGLVASGTTSKQLDRMKDARTIGYGGMLGEGTLAMVAVVATVAGVGLTSTPWAERYASWETVGNSGIKNFVDGAAMFLKPLMEPLVGLFDWIFGIQVDPVALASTVVAVIVISFAATTLDTAARIQRFCLGELGGAFKMPVLKNRFVGAAVAVVPAAMLAIFTQHPAKGPGSGGFILWPLFGTTNQLVGGLTLLLLVVYLKSRRRPVLPILIPMIFLVVMTTIAGVMNLRAQWASESPNWPVVLFGILFLLLEALMFVEAYKTLRAGPPPEARPV